MPEIRYSDRFIDDLAAIYSSKVLAEIDSVLQSLERFPELGSPRVRPVLAEAFGLGLRMLPVSSFLIIYRYTGQTIDVLALVYGPRVI